MSVYEAMKGRLEATRRKHYYCEDTWYSCPAEPTEGCANDSRGPECDCGADRHNAELDDFLRLMDLEGESAQPPEVSDG
jgi:hypothetical protein